MEFAVGDQVLISTRNLQLEGTRKLKPRFVGPFKVTAKVGSTAYKLDLQGRFATLHPVLHVSQLRKHLPGGSSPAPPAPVERDGNLEFEIEHISRHRRRGRQFEYLVRWEGYGPEHDEWMTEDNLVHARSILEAYKTANGLL